MYDDKHELRITHLDTDEVPKPDLHIIMSKWESRRDINV